MIKTLPGFVGDLNQQFGELSGSYSVDILHYKDNVLHTVEFLNGWLVTLRVYTMPFQIYILIHGPDKPQFSFAGGYKDFFMWEGADEVWSLVTEVVDWDILPFEELIDNAREAAFPKKNTERKNYYFTPE